MKARRVAVVVVALATLAACGSDGGGSGTASKFCNAARTAKAAQDAQQKLFDIAGSPTPAQVQPVVEDFAAKFAALSAVAPPQIKKDVDTLNTVAQDLLTVVRDNAYDVVAMVSTPGFAAVNQAFSNLEYQSAQSRFQDYIDTNCKITPTSGT